MKHEIATLNNYKNFISVPALEKNVGKMLNAKAGVEKNEWVFAIALNNIIESELFKTDFGTAQNFADWMGIDGGTISKCKGAIRCMVNTMKKYGYEMNDLSYSKAYRLSSLEKKMDEFIKFCEGEGVTDFRNVSVHNLAKLIKLFKDGGSTQTETESTETESTETESTETEKTFEGKYNDTELWFKLDGIAYVLPRDVLQNYKVNC